MINLSKYNVNDTILEIRGPQAGRNYNCFNVAAPPAPKISVISNDSSTIIQVLQGTVDYNQSAHGANGSSIISDLAASTLISLGNINGSGNVTPTVSTDLPNVIRIIKIAGSGNISIITKY